MPLSSLVCGSYNWTEPSLFTCTAVVWSATLNSAPVAAYEWLSALSKVMNGGLHQPIPLCHQFGNWHWFSSSPKILLTGSWISSRPNFSAFALPRNVLKTLWSWLPCLRSASISEVLSILEMAFFSRKTKLLVVHCVPRVFSWNLSSPWCVVALTARNKLKIMMGK